MLHDSFFFLERNFDSEPKNVAPPIVACKIWEYAAQIPNVVTEFGDERASENRVRSSKSIELEKALRRTRPPPEIATHHELVL